MPAIFSSSDGSWLEMEQKRAALSSSGVRDRVRPCARRSNKVESLKKKKKKKIDGEQRVPFSPAVRLWGFTQSLTARRGLFSGRIFPSWSDESRCLASCLVTHAMKIDRVVSTFVPGFLVRMHVRMYVRAVRHVSRSWK